MSIEDGKPLTQKESIDLFREKLSLEWWMDFLLLHRGESPDRLFEMMEKRIFDLKNSSGEQLGKLDAIWDDLILGSVPTLEGVAERIRTKLSAP